VLFPSYPAFNYASVPQTVSFLTTQIPTSVNQYFPQNGFSSHSPVISLYPQGWTQPLLSATSQVTPVSPPSQYLTEHPTTLNYATISLLQQPTDIHSLDATSHYSPSTQFPFSSYQQGTDTPNYFFSIEHPFQYSAQSSDTTLDCLHSHEERKIHHLSHTTGT